MKSDWTGKYVAHGQDERTSLKDTHTYFIATQHKGFLAGADPGFFLGGGAQLRNGVTDW